MCMTGKETRANADSSASRYILRFVWIDIVKIVFSDRGLNMRITKLRVRNMNEQREIAKM